LLPARSPNLNAFAERWVRSIKSEQWMTQMARHAVDEIDGAFPHLNPRMFWTGPQIETTVKTQISIERRREP
jgi:hypothetical protein